MSAPSGMRRRAREVVFRVAYQADIAGDSYKVAWKLRRDDEAALSKDQTELIDDLVAALEARSAEVDAAITTALDASWSLPRLAATDRAVLRVGVAELLARPGSPARVVLDESIDMASHYGSDGSGGFVNGVLDKVARTLRPGEF